MQPLTSIADLAAAFSDLQKQREADCSSFKHEIFSIGQSLLSSQNQYTELKSQFDGLQVEYEKLKQKSHHETEDLKQKQEKTLAECETMKASLADSIQQRELYKREIEKLQQENQALAEKLGKIERHEACQLQLDELRLHLEQVKNRFTDLNQENFHLKAQVEELKTKQQELTAELDAKENQLILLESELDATTNQVAAYALQNSDLVNELSAEREKIAASEAAFLETFSLLEVQKKEFDQDNDVNYWKNLYYQEKQVVLDLSRQSAQMAQTAQMIIENSTRVREENGRLTAGAQNVLQQWRDEYKQEGRILLLELSTLDFSNQENLNQWIIRAAAQFDIPAEQKILVRNNLQTKIGQAQTWKNATMGSLVIIAAETLGLALI